MLRGTAGAVMTKKMSNQIITFRYYILLLYIWIKACTCEEPKGMDEVHHGVPGKEKNSFSRTLLQCFYGVLLCIYLLGLHNREYFIDMCQEAL